MNREEFVKWVDEVSSFRNEFVGDNVNWKYESDYENGLWDYLEILEDKVVFTWEEYYWGGSNMRHDEYSFDDFARLSENYELKNQKNEKY